VSAVLVAFAVVLLAEMGDKSQLVALSLASKFSPWVTLAAVAAASMVLHGLAATVGVALAQAVPARARAIGAGCLFIGFAIWTLWRAWQEHANAQGVADDGPIAAKPRRSVFFAIALTFFVSEFGDKTQLAVATLATSRNAFLTWIGAVVGMVVADGVAIAAGAGLRRVLRPRVVALIAATGFAATGLVLLANA
jgi:putative Ca2+/H+ antiporter (TMEM165/GDT1 family)